MKTVRVVNGWATKQRLAWPSTSGTWTDATWMRTLLFLSLELMKSGTKNKNSAKSLAVNSIASGKNVRNVWHEARRSTQIRSLILQRLTTCLTGECSSNLNFPSREVGIARV